MFRFNKYIIIKNFLLNILLFLCIAALFNSCNGKEHKQEVAKIDSLISELRKINNIIAQIDSNEISAKYSEYNNNIKLLRINFNDKYKEDKEIWNAMAQYGYIKKPIKNYFSRIPEIKREVSVSEKKLDTLKNDIKNNCINGESFKKYFKAEADNVTYLNDLATITIEQARTELKKFDSLNPIIIQVIEKLKNKK